MAANVATYFRFSHAIDRNFLEVEGRATRFKLVDAGEHTMVLEMAVEPGFGEKVGGKVRYKDGATPAYARFSLVSHPTLVDKEVEVVRQALPSEALEAALRGLPNLAFLGLLDSKGLQAHAFWGMASPGDKGGLEPGLGVGYRATLWAMVVVRVRNLPGQPAWAPGSARLTSARGTQVKVHSVHMEKPQLQPGESALVAVLVDPPPSDEGRFQLELVDSEGRRLLLITKVEL